MVGRDNRVEEIYETWWKNVCTVVIFWLREQLKWETQALIIPKRYFVWKSFHILIFLNHSFFVVPDIPKTWPGHMNLAARKLASTLLSSVKLFTHLIYFSKFAIYMIFPDAEFVQSWILLSYFWRVLSSGKLLLLPQIYITPLPSLTVLFKGLACLHKHKNTQTQNFCDSCPRASEERLIKGDTKRGGGGGGGGERFIFQHENSRGWGWGGRGWGCNCHKVTK